MNEEEKRCTHRNTSSYKISEVNGRARWVTQCNDCGLVIREWVVKR